jgi:hypothetical protein
VDRLNILEVDFWIYLQVPEIDETYIIRVYNPAVGVYGYVIKELSEKSYRLQVAVHRKYFWNNLHQVPS